MSKKPVEIPLPEDKMSEFLKAGLETTHSKLLEWVNEQEKKAGKCVILVESDYVKNAMICAMINTCLIFHPKIDISKAIDDILSHREHIVEELRKYKNSKKGEKK